MNAYIWIVLLIVPIAKGERVAGGGGADEISWLPGLSFEPQFRQFSGYLNGGTHNHLHYWFVESQRSPKEDPVVVWLNGGPGCSSLIGLLGENGPYRVDRDGEHLRENIFSWNKLANIVYLESPGGVGYSYTVDQSGDATSDNQTAAMNYEALLSFFAKFGQFNGSDFYLAGESYAGVFIPTLANLILSDKDFPAPLKGISIGNGFFGQRFIQNSYLEFLYNHGTFGDDLWLPIVYDCCNDTAMCDFMPFFQNFTTNPHCSNLTMKAAESTRGLDPYNLYESCYERLWNWTLKEDEEDEVSSPYTEDGIREGYLNGIRQGMGIDLWPEWVGDWEEGDCSHLGFNLTATYLNRPEVKAALHVPFGLPAWQTCNKDINDEWVHNYDDMAKEVASLVTAKVRVLIYNGDVDSVCNFVSGERFADHLAHHLKLKVMESRKAWHYAEMHPSLAGFYQRWDGLDFLTIRGAGHFAPSDKPREAIQVFGNFLAASDYNNPVSFPVTPAPPPVTGSEQPQNMTTGAATNHTGTPTLSPTVHPTKGSSHLHFSFFLILLSFIAIASHLE